MTDPAFTRDMPDVWDDGWSRVPHGLWTLDLPAGAKLLLGWLHSHTDQFLARITITQCRRAVGSSQIFVWFDALETAGYITVTRRGDGKPARITLVTAAWRRLLAVRNQPDTTPKDIHNQSDFGSVTSPISDCIEEQGEEHPSSSLRSEEQASNTSFVDTREGDTRTLAAEVAKQVWDRHMDEQGIRPTIEFVALMAIAKRLLKTGCEPGEIVDAMMTSRGWTAKTVSAEIVRHRAERENRPSTIAVPSTVVTAVNKASRWLRDQQVTTPLPAQMVASARLTAMGFGLGETVCRLAVASRFDPTITDADVLVKAMLKANSVDRFDGPLDDYRDATMRAWTNSGWRA